ncbi:response regulator transcription factor [Erysipelothrix sp. HDW6C]|uniref:response regulator transcription factor n=1 Tax=Erysipelothrix sp. HDW6C TaxID=2714930 RepID=UPI00140893EE|nr:winged helix-turn-helix domain-containing protein [Erysipelothrix sp. HDW6C]QIK70637.1 response regulator transcription factor [Erysipelothrix sp. HDW6C]
MTYRKIKVLVIDNDVNFAKGLQSKLNTEKNCEVDITNTIDQALQMILSNQYRLIISEYHIEDGVDDMQGMGLLRVAKNRNRDVRRVLLTDYSDEKAVEALSDSVNLFLTKDRCLDVICEYIMNDCQTNSNTIDAVARYNMLSGDARFNQINSGVQNSENLTTTEWDIVNVLLDCNNRVVSRDDIVESLFGEAQMEAVDFNTRTIDVHIKNIRRKMPNHQIRTVRGVGYMWKQ